jgi:hypothetical protein
MTWLLYSIFIITMQAYPASTQTAGTSGNQNVPAQDRPKPVESSLPPAPSVDKPRIAEIQPSVNIDKIPPVTVVPQKRDWADWGYWVFSALLVVVGGFQVWLLWRTLGAITEQANLMERQAKANEDAVMAARDNALAAVAGAEAARANAESAEATVRQMKGTARRELRARVSVVGAKRLGAATSGSYQAEITIKNFGRVTAYRCTCIVDLVLRPNGANDDQFPPPRATGEEPNMSLPPGGEFTMVRNLDTGTFENRQHSDVMAGTLAIYFYGRIVYRDGFRSGRYSDFRMKCCGPDYSLNRFAFCEKGNRAG